MDRYEKLTILAEGAKYDASCSTSGVERKGSGRMGSASCAGICHSWAADGRCISLLKVLMTNKCAYDCEYCVNRRSADVSRASFEPEELASLVIEFYRRNYIEGLFLSSAVEGTPDGTSERMLRCLRILREEEGFGGYIHAKIIPGTSPELVQAIGLTADRISVNMELPTQKSLRILAPQKTTEGIFGPMKQITEELGNRRQLKSGGDALWDRGERLARLDGTGEAGLWGPARSPGRLAEASPSYGSRRSGSGLWDTELLDDPEAGVFYGGSSERAIRSLPAKRSAGPKVSEVFAPAGQTTQMIIGASGETDAQIVGTMEALYRTFRLKRVYYSAYIPVRESPLLPALLTPPPLRREHRLYQADWLLRFYGFSADEIVDRENPFLDAEVDPKMAWALRHMERFPVEINKASKEELLRIPGIGEVSARRILRQKRRAAVHFDDLKNLGVVVKRARYFITCCGRFYGDLSMDPERIRGLLLQEEETRKIGKYRKNSILQIDDKAKDPILPALSGGSGVGFPPQEAGEQLTLF